MAGTYNSKTGYLTVNGMDVLAPGVVTVDEIKAQTAAGVVFVNDSLRVHAGAVFDSEVIIREKFTTFKENYHTGAAFFYNTATFSTSIVADGGVSVKTNHDYHNLDSEWVLSLINIDSDVVKTIANNVRLNDLIDSDRIGAIARAEATGIALDSDEVASVARGELTTINANIVNFDSDIEYIYTKLTKNDSDQQLLKGKYFTIETNDGVQDVQLTEHDSDIAYLARQAQDHLQLIYGNDSDIAVLQTNIINIDDSDTRVRIATLEANTGYDQYGAETGGGHEDRITQLEATVAAQAATIAALTLSGLTDVDVTGLSTGDALVWNGVNWAAVTN